MAMSTDVPLFEGFVDTTMDALRLIEVRSFHVHAGQSIGETDRNASVCICPSGIMLVYRLHAEVSSPGSLVVSTTSSGGPW